MRVSAFLVLAAAFVATPVFGGEVPWADGEGAKAKELEQTEFKPELQWSGVFVLLPDKWRNIPSSCLPHASNTPATSDTRCRADGSKEPCTVNRPVTNHPKALPSEPSPDKLHRLVDEVANRIGEASPCATVKGDQATATCSAVKEWLKGEIDDNRADAILEGPIAQQALLELRRRVTYLKKWLGEYKVRCDRTDGELVGCGDLLLVEKRLGKVRRQLSEALEAAGLRETITAEFVTGLMFQRTDSEPSSGANSDAPAYLQLRSRRFGTTYDQDRRVEFQFGGRIGRMSVLTLLAPTSIPTPTPAPSAAASPSPGPSPSPNPESPSEDVAATDQMSTAMDLRGDIVWSPTTSLELAATFAVGQVWLDSKTIVRTVDGKQEAFATVPSQSGLNGNFWEAGVRLRFFNDLPRGVRAEQPSIAPTVELGFDYRRDSRFKFEGPVVGIDSPEKRMVVGIGLNGIPIVNKKDPAGHPLALGLVVEHEFGFAGGLPASTRLLLRGDVQVIKALMGAK